MADQALKRARTCIGCNEQSTKTQLLRIVRRNDGTVAFDATGRVAGRGAYVCSVKCLEAAMKKGKLQKALKTDVSPSRAEQIANEMIGFCADEDAR